MPIKILIDERATALVNYVLDSSQYGDVIDHDHVARLIGVEQSLTETYYMIVSNARSQLIPYGKTIISVPGVGYKILEPDEYNHYAYRLFVQGMKKINKARDVSRFAPIHLMTEENQVINQKVTVHIASYADVIRKNAEELRKLVNPIGEETD